MRSARWVVRLPETDVSRDYLNLTVLGVRGNAFRRLCLLNIGHIKVMDYLLDATALKGTVSWIRTKRQDRPTK